jgi:hypothetical protein
MNSLLLLLIVTPLINACIDLTSFITDETAENLELVAAGGNLSSINPLYFDVGRQQVNPNTPLTFCLNGLRIPTKVGNNVCNGSQQCFLAVGMKANDNGMNMNLDDCTSFDRGIAPCYNCLCQGLEWVAPPGAADNETISNACGLSSPDRWGITCTDKENGRNVNDTFATVHITACPDLGGLNDCNVCSGGTLPAFQVAVQWLSESCVIAGWPSAAWRITYSCMSVWGIVSTSLFMMLI